MSRTNTGLSPGRPVFVSQSTVGVNPKGTMDLYFKTAAGLLLLVQALHLASLQESTDSPGRTIDKSWLRELARKIDGSQNTSVSEDEAKNDQGTKGVVSGNVIGTEFDFMTPHTEEENNVVRQDKNTSEASTDLTAVNEPPTSLQTQQRNSTTSPNATATTVPTNSSRTNGTEGEEDFHNSTTTTHLSERNSTFFPDNSNRTALQTTTLAPETNATQGATTTPAEATRSTNATESNATESNATTTATNTTKQGMNETSATSSSTTALPSETAETSPPSTTAGAAITPEIANRTDADAASGSGSERGSEEDGNRGKRNGTWVALMGMALAVIVIGLVAYVILKKKNGKGFTHRKLVEQYPSDPVLRLDNGTTLDLNFGLDGSAYYNPALQADNIQMSNFPGRR